MNDVPRYHEQPATLDPRQEIPEDAPLAQGHLDKPEDVAADVRDAAETHKQAVEQVEQARTQAREAGEPEPGAPGDPTVRRDADGEQIDSDDEDVPDGTVDEVVRWVGDDPGRASRALNVERAGQNRTTLVSQLESLAR
jgi:hypothetical protein